MVVENSELERCAGATVELLDVSFLRKLGAACGSGLCVFCVRKPHSGVGPLVACLRKAERKQGISGSKTNTGLD